MLCINVLIRMAEISLDWQTLNKKQVVIWINLIERVKNEIIIASRLCMRYIAYKNNCNEDENNANS